MYGICNLSIVALKAAPSDSSEMVSQILFGEVFTILEQQKYWSKIQLASDGFEGFIDHKQFEKISEDLYQKLLIVPKVYAGEFIDFITDSTNGLLTIPIGSSLPFFADNHFFINSKKYNYQGKVFTEKLNKSEIIRNAFTFLNAPFLWGGKTPFGIDCSGFTQMVYKLNGYKLFRDASQQANQGEALSFIEESEPGDLAFFDNAEGNITHVGIIMEDNHIIHAHGKVRIDRLDHSGIYNTDKNIHTHKLRVIKKII